MAVVLCVCFYKQIFLKNQSSFILAEHYLQKPYTHTAPTFEAWEWTNNTQPIKKRAHSGINGKCWICKKAMPLLCVGPGSPGGNVGKICEIMITSCGKKSIKLWVHLAAVLSAFTQHDFVFWCPCFDALFSEDSGLHKYYKHFEPSLKMCVHFTIIGW